MDGRALGKDLRRRCKMPLQFRVVEGFEIHRLELEVAPAQPVALFAEPALRLLAPCSRAEDLARGLRSPPQLRVKQEHCFDDQLRRRTSRFFGRAYWAWAGEHPPVDDPGVEAVDEDAVARETVPISPFKGREDHRVQVARPGRRLVDGVAHPGTGAGRCPLVRRHRAHSLINAPGVGR